MFGIFLVADLISESEVVKVIFDKFEFVQSDVKYIEEGGFCSKHCQCAGECVNGKCEG